MVRNGIHLVFFHFVVQSRNVEWFGRVGKFSSQHCIHVDSAVLKEKSTLSVHCTKTRRGISASPSPLRKDGMFKKIHVHLHAPYVHLRPVGFVSQDLWGCISWGPALGLKMLPSRLSVRRRDKKCVTEAKI